MKALVWTVMGLVISGCATRTPYVKPKPVVISTAGIADEECLEQLQKKSKAALYVEQSVEPERFLFRVIAKNIGADGRLRTKPPRSVDDKSTALVQFYEVQCLGGQRASVKALHAYGEFTDEYIFDLQQQSELATFAGAIGATNFDGQTGSARVPRCVASKLPEWKRASASEKRELIERCRPE